MTATWVPFHAARPGAAPAPAPARPGSGRDAHGRWAEGNNGGPGNPYARQQAALRREVVQFMSEGRMRPLCDALYERALKGDTAAARILVSYGLGKAQEAVHPDDVEAHELATFRAATATNADARSATGYPAGMVNQFLAGTRPVLAEVYRREMGRGFHSIGAEHDARRAAEQEIHRQQAAQEQAAPAYRAPSLEEIREGMRHSLLAGLAPLWARRDSSRPDAHRGPAAVNKRSSDGASGNSHRADRPPDRR